MKIVISTSTTTPIYEQIVKQIRDAVVSGEVQAGEGLPSIRTLAKDLTVSVITTKRAYEELEKEGFIYTIPAKGCYVAPKNLALIREENLKQIEAHIEQILQLATTCNISKEEILEMVRFGMEE